MLARDGSKGDQGDTSLAASRTQFAATTRSSPTQTPCRPGKSRGAAKYSHEQEIAAEMMVRDAIQAIS